MGCFPKFLYCQKSVCASIIPTYWNTKNNRLNKNHVILACRKKRYEENEGIVCVCGRDGEEGWIGWGEEKDGRAPLFLSPSLSCEFTPLGRKGLFLSEKSRFRWISCTSSSESAFFHFRTSCPPSSSLTGRTSLFLSAKSRFYPSSIFLYFLPT